ncbi:uroporphyrinogen-III synthase [Larsenimonas salina]|uniref:uroporphyrinogen-III synthase n=1 Tax=Larsenimonas salina TaxID=1295565 RepID=UPI002074246B|nr:uroporphyrinogen-III synthase [Larsenimonas salina]MCM5705248.1 uroporphyrinogen-III synthase [Larsenimonas salina]
MASAKPRVVIARPGARAKALEQDIEALGAEVLNLGVMQLVPLEDASGDTRRRLLDLDLYQIVLVTSPFAAACLLEWIDDLWPQYPIGITWWGTGASTAEVLSHGLGEDVGAPPPGSGSASEALLSMPAFKAEAVSGQRVLLVGGEGGRTLLHETLMQRGASVDTLALYKRTVHTPEPHHQRVLEDGAFRALILTSAEQLEHLLLWCSDSTKKRPLVVSSQRLAETASFHGFTAITIAGDASPTALARAVAHCVAPSNLDKG